VRANGWLGRLGAARVGLPPLSILPVAPGGTDGLTLAESSGLKMLLKSALTWAFGLLSNPSASTEH